MNEIWKDIEGFEGSYQVSNEGRVRSLPRYKRKTERILKPSPNNVGYMLVQLRSGGKERKSKLVHRLVMQAFEPITEFMEVNHKDLDITNNSLSNLEWVTRQENIDHYNNSEKAANINRSTTVGSNHHLSDLTDEIVIELRRRWELVKDVYGAGRALSREFNIKDSTRRQITSGATWKHLL